MLTPLPSDNFSVLYSSDQWRPSNIFQGAYCVDFDIYYGDGGDEIRYYPEGVVDDKACRKLCQDNNRCRFYSYSEKTCSLLGNDDFTPEYDDTAISGTVDGECRNMRPTENYPEVRTIHNLSTLNIENI